jgi:hypothetical protein
MKFTLAHNALVPFDDDARDWLGDRTHIVGEVCQVAVLDQKEKAFRGYVFVVLTKLAKFAGTTIDEMRARLMVETGRCVDVKLYDGRTALCCKSMNLLSMNDDEMRSFWRDAKKHIELMLPRFTEQDANEIRELIQQE